MAVPHASVASALPAQGPWQLAVFDLDGTLVDTRRDLLEGLGDAIGEEMFDDQSRERAAAALHLGMRAMVAAALGDAGRDEKRVAYFLDRYSQAYSARIARHSKPYLEVPETLRWLRHRGVKLAVCSNKSQDLSRVLLRILGLWEFFPVIVGPESTGQMKPHPEPLRHAAWASCVAKAHAVLIGDSGIDVECAERAGMDCWLFSGGYEPGAAPRASMCFDRFEELRQPAYWMEHSALSAQRSSS
jgi:phosphoglycolate phosphatase